MKYNCPFLESLNRNEIYHAFKNDSFSLMKEVIPEDDTKLYLRNESIDPFPSLTENEITVSFIPLRELIE